MLVHAVSIDSGILQCHFPKHTLATKFQHLLQTGNSFHNSNNLILKPHVITLF